MNPEAIAGALALTGAIFVVAFMSAAIWVGSASRGYDRRKWHRPAVTILGAIAGALFIAAAWTLALS